MATAKKQTWTSQKVSDAISKTSGRFYSGTKTSASNRIKRESELRKAFGRNTTYNVNNEGFRERLGLNRPNRYLTAQRGATVTRHNADRKDPTTGVGMNIKQNRRYRVSLSGSVK